MGAGVAPLRLVGALTLRSAQSPALTRDETGRLCVFIGRGKSVGQNIQLLSPLIKDMVTTGAQELASALRRAGFSEEDEASEVEQRAPVEAIGVCLDTSASMRSTSVFGDEAGLSDEEDDGDLLDDFSWAKKRDDDDSDDEVISIGDSSDERDGDSDVDSDVDRIGRGRGRRRRRRRRRR